MKKRARQHGYKVLGTFKPETILPQTGPKEAHRAFVDDNGNVWKVKMTSLRYQTFKHSLRCRCCGIEGSMMLLELPKGSDTPHFNLYAEREGELVQMTKDHKTPKSCGGKDHINNMQTMCSRCNELKGDRGGKLKRLREIQDGVQTVYTVLYPNAFPMDGFATSDKGLAEIVRQYIVEFYNWNEDSFEIRVSIRLRTVQVISGVGKPVVFRIGAIRRV